MLLGWCVLIAASACPAAAQNTTPAPVPGFNGARMVMSQSVWQKFVIYLNNTAATGFGFFMISVDGQRSTERVCADYVCQIGSFEQQRALDDCKIAFGNTRCVVFAEGRNIKMGYQVLP